MRRRCRKFFRLPDGPLHPLHPGREDDLGPEYGQQLTPLDAHRLRHGQDQPIAACGGHKGKGDPRIAACRFNDDRFLGDDPLLLGILDHGDADPVLHTGKGIEGLHFDDHLSHRPCVDSI